jgi:outer membrane protein OmpA-like peptidoglycan-associated protein
MSIDSFFEAEKSHLDSYILQLYGHCDSIGAESFNQRLSQKRVATVKKYFANKGFNLYGITNAIVKGYGEKDPLHKNDNEEGRQLNRRVEIILSKVVETNMPGTEQLRAQLRSLTETMADTSTKVGSTIVLNNINFYGGSPLPLPEAFNTLDELLEIMRVNYKLVIEVRGHVCCVASPGDVVYGSTGNGLSEERARTVYAYLIGNGIEASRVSYKGFGHSAPIYPFPEKNEEERKMNRRVEIKIIGR